MQDWVPNVLVFVACYLVGGIPCGLLIGKLNGVDIRSEGSGNIGATNVLRVCGKKWGYLCFAADMLKGFLPVLIARSQSLPHADFTAVFAILAVVFGHVWSPYIGFKGGKGVATSAGAILAVTPFAVLAALAIWYLVFSVSRYVSLASITAALVIPFVALALNRSGAMGGSALSTPTMTLLFVLAVLIVLKHHSNIRRLLSGTENKFVRKSREDDSAPETSP